MPNLGPAGRGGARRRTRRRMGRRQDMAQDSQPQQAAPAEPAATQSPTEQLQQLGELHKEGIITDQEFEEKKKELLAQI